MKHILLKNEDDRKELAFKYIEFKWGNKQIWKDEDMPLLKPFLDYNNKKTSSKSIPMNDEESKSFDHYMRCKSEYADELFNIKNSVSYIPEAELSESFGYTIEFCKNAHNCSSDECESCPEFLSGKDVLQDILETPLNYPVIAVIFIDSDYDRLGKSSCCIVDYVELKEFKK